MTEKLTRMDYMKLRLGDILFLCNETMPTTIEEYEKIMARVRYFAQEGLRPEKFKDLVEDA